MSGKEKDGTDSRKDPVRMALARANVEAAELMVELEEKNLALSRANASSAEMMAELEINKEKIERLNGALAKVNVQSAGLVVDIELKMEELEELNRKLGQEINQRKEAEAQLQDKNDELEVANKIKSEFVGIVSHDFGNPIGVIMGNVEMFLMGLFGDLTPKMKEKLEVVFETSQRLNKLRLDTLDLSKMDLGKMELNREKGDLALLLGKVVETTRISADKKKQQIEIVESPKSLVLNYDDGRIYQVLQNYLSNAVRYSPEGTSIEAGIKEREDDYLVWVKDAGRGIDQKHLENVFLAFFRTGTKVKGSTGLGLSIVKGIVDAHGGRAWAESEGEGKGSSFFFSLPKE